MLSRLLRRPGSIDVREAARRLEAGEIVLVDVREATEWRGGRAVDAVHLPLSAIAQGAPALAAQAMPVAFICRSGHRSTAACRAARRQGIDALGVRGGMIAWQRAGLPIAKG